MFEKKSIDFCIFNQKLDKLLSKGKNILQLTEICGKYETEKEKVQPFKSQNLSEKPKETVITDGQTLNGFKEVR